MGKIVYEKEQFKEVPPTTEERLKELREKLQPWKFDPNKVVLVGGKAGEPSPSPSPTPTPSQTALPTPTPSITPTPSATPGPSIPMTDLITWYDTSDTSTITEVGGQVSQLNDKSGNGFNLTQGTSSYQPLTFSDAVGAGIIFDGSDDRLSNTTMTGYSSVTGLTKFFVFTKSVFRISIFLYPYCVNLDCPAPIASDLFFNLKSPFVTLTNCGSIFVFDVVFEK